MAGGQGQVLAHFGQGQGVAFFGGGFGDLALGNAVGGEHGADLGQGVGRAHLDVAKLAVGVGDQVVEQVVRLGAGGLGFDAGLLAQGVHLAVGHHGGQLDEQA